MPMNTASVENASIVVQQQFQADQDCRRDESAPVAPAVFVMDSELILDLGDISLAMRQFYQSPVKNGG